MGFKRNITITIACVITECLLSLIPSILIIYIFFMLDRIKEIFTTLLIVPYLIVIINAVLIIISLISQVFMKTKYYVNKESLLIKNKDKIKEIKYDTITSIAYDFGDLTKFNTKPSQIVLFDKDFNELLSINNPSIIMVHMIKKKCKNAKTSYYHNKKFLFLFAIINGIVLLISIVAKLFF